MRASRDARSSSLSSAAAPGAASSSTPSQRDVAASFCCLRCLQRAHRFLEAVLGSWGKAMRGAGRNKGGWERRRTPTQDPSTDNLDGYQAPFPPAVADRLLLRAHTAAMERNPAALRVRAAETETRILCLRVRVETAVFYRLR